MVLMHLVDLDDPNAVLQTPDHSYGLHLHAQDLKMGPETQHILNPSSHLTLCPQGELSNSDRHLLSSEGHGTTKPEPLTQSPSRAPKIL